MSHQPRIYIKRRLLEKGTIKEFRYFPFQCEKKKKNRRLRCLRVGRATN